MGQLINRQDSLFISAKGRQRRVLIYLNSMCQLPSVKQWQDVTQVHTTQECRLDFIVVTLTTLRLFYSMHGFLCFVIFLPLTLSSWSK